MTNPSHIRLIETATHQMLWAMLGQNTVRLAAMLGEPSSTLTIYEKGYIKRRIRNLEEADRQRLPVADYIDPRAIVPKGAE